MQINEITLYSRIMLGVCAVLGFVIAAEALVINGNATNDDIAEVGDLSESDEASQATVPKPLRIPPIAAYRDVVERPLFADTRRPPAVASMAVAQLPAAQLNSKWKLTGVILAGKDSTAYVKGVRDNNTIHLGVGMPLDGWRVEKIAADHVEFSFAGRTATLQLHEEEKDQPVLPIRRP